MKRILIAAVTIILVHVANAQWTQCPIYGGKINALAVKDSNVFAGTLNGIFLSDNYAYNWDSINIGLPSYKNIYTIAVRGNEIYAGLANFGMYKSINNGATWMSISTGLPLNNYTPWSIHFVGNDIFIASPNSNGGIYMSDDNGNTWSNVNNNITDSSICCLVSNSSGIYAGSMDGGGIFKTTDNGASWNSSNTGLPTGWFSVNALVVKDTTVYAGIQTPISNSIYKSSNGGLTWTFCSNISSYITELSVCGNKIFMGTENGVYYSTDGQNWLPVNTGLTNKYIKSFAVNGLDIFTGTMGGVFLLTESSTSWTPVNNGINTFSFNAIDNINNHLFAGERNTGIYYTGDHGNTWEAKNNGLSDLQIVSMETNGISVYTGTYYGVYKTNDNGNNWSVINNIGLPYGYAARKIIAKGSNIFIATSLGIYKSLDNGATWSIANTGLPSTSVLSIAIDSNGNVYATINDVGVFLSSDNGANWVNISNGFPGMIYTSCITTSDSYILTGLEGYNPPVVYSDNNGISWQVGNNGLFGHTVNTLETIGNCVFAGVSDGLFFTKNNGLDWINMSDNLPLNSVISIGRDDSCIYAGVEGQGIWKRTLSDFAIDFTENTVINLSATVEIYPNPATTNLYLNNPENLEVKILNLQGQTVSTKTISSNGNIDISGLSNGVYMVQINTKNGILYRKFVKQ